MKTSKYSGPGDLKDCPLCAGCCISAMRQGVENCQWGRPRNQLNQFAELTQQGAQRKERSLLQGAEFTSAPCCTRIPTTTAAPAPAAACKAAGVKAPGRPTCESGMRHSWPKTFRSSPNRQLFRNSPQTAQVTIRDSSCSGVR